MGALDLIRKKARWYLSKHPKNVLKKANEGETKTSMLRDINQDDGYTAFWVIAEVMMWESPEMYYDEIDQKGFEDEDYYIWKLYDKYVKVSCLHPDYNVNVEVVYPKKRIIEQIYFE